MQTRSAWKKMMWQPEVEGNRIVSGTTLRWKGGVDHLTVLQRYSGTICEAKFTSKMNKFWKIEFPEMLKS